MLCVLSDPRVHQDKRAEPYLSSQGQILSVLAVEQAIASLTDG